MNSPFWGHLISVFLKFSSYLQFSENKKLEKLLSRMIKLYIDYLNSLCAYLSRCECVGVGMGR